METFTHAENPLDDVYEKSKSGSDTDIETDLEAKGRLWAACSLSYFSFCEQA